MIVYVGTLAPTITWTHTGADSGDLITAAYAFGIPHPSGYPLYMLLAGCAAHVPLGDPARNVNLLSAACAALTVFMLARAIRFIIGDVPFGLVSSLFSPLLALVFAFTPLFWSQAVIAEVYPLHMLFVVALFAVLLSSISYRFELAAVILGLGLTHHLTIILVVPGAFLLIDRRLARKEIVRGIIAFLLPLTLYFYMPLRAWTDPPVNWGGVTTLERFWWMVSGVAYRPYLFSLSATDVLARSSSMARLFFDQFGVWGVALGLWGFVQMGGVPTEREHRRWGAFCISLGIILTFALFYGSKDAFVYLLPVMAIFILGMGYGVGDLVRRFPMRTAPIVLVVALGLFSAYNLIANWQAMDLSNDHAAVDYAEQVFRTVPNDALVLAHGDEHLFALWYYRYVREPSSQVLIVSAELLQFDWYIEQVNRQLPWTKFSSPAQLENTAYAQRLTHVIDTSLQNGRAVYTTQSNAWLVNYQMQDSAGLFLIQNGRR